jgi:hypothetical protein
LGTVEVASEGNIEKIPGPGSSGAVDGCSY